MRAAAVLTVFANHLFGWPVGGFVGVDIFFVLSGFFITGILIRERTSTHRISFANFYTRRAKRILPSALLVITVTVAAGYLLFPATRARETLIDGLYATIFASNWRFQAVGADYFQQDQPPSPLQHYWSLSIEEQFYFIWPLLLVVIFAATRRAALAGHPRARQWGLFGSMAVIVAASFAWAVYQSRVDPNSAYFSTITRIWELGVGALLAIAGVWLARIPEGARPALAYLGLGGVVASLFLVDGNALFPAPWAALPVLSTALVVAAFHGSEVRGVAVLTNPVARWFGDTSYTLYLWHWPVITLLVTVMPEGPAYYIAAVCLPLGLTAVTYHYYEDPIRKSGWLTGRKANVSRWGVLAVLMVTVVVMSLMGIHQRQRLDLIAQEARNAVTVDAPPPQVETPAASQAHVIAPLTSPMPGNAPCFGAPAMLDENCQLRTPGAPLTPGVDSFTNDRTTPGLGCWAEKGARFAACTKGYTGSDAVRIALVGDSHAALLLVALTPYLQAMKWQLTIFTGWGCSWRADPTDQCRDSLAEMGLIERRFDAVLTTARREPVDPDSYARAWSPVAAAGTRVIAVADNPTVRENVLSCVSRGDPDGSCGMPRGQALSVRDPLPIAVGMVPGATAIDLTQYYCDETRCPAVIGDVIVYSDTNHITATYMRTLGPAVVEGLRQALTRTAMRP